MLCSRAVLSYVRRAVKDLTFDKVRVLERLNQNMAKHIGEYAEALSRFEEERIDLLKKTLADAEAGKDVDQNFLRVLPIPQDYSDEYARVIDQLNMATDPSVTMSTGEFNQWMRDEWQWKGVFAASTQSYLGPQ